MPMLIRLPLLLLLLCLASPAQAGSGADLGSHPIYGTYRFGGAAKVVDLGTQPLAVPIGVVTAVMEHDRLLAKALSKKGWQLRNHGFLKGPDVNFFFERGDLDLAMAGDWPTISFAGRHDIVVVALAKQGFSSLVAKEFSQLADLKDKRIGVALGTTAQYGLLTALEYAGLTESDVKLVAMENNQVSEALARNQVEAFASWEPVTSQALRNHPEFKVVQRFLNSSYVYFSKNFIKNNPEIAELVLASYVRSLRWMRQSDANLELGVEWMLVSSERLLKKPSGLAAQTVAAVTTSDLLNIASSPAVPRQDLTAEGRVHRAFQFLKSRQKIAADVLWERIAVSFDRTLIEKVLADPGKYQLLSFDYGN